MTTGSGSSFPLTRLASKYQQMIKDGRILSNRHSLEIVRHRIEQLAERIDLNDAPDRFAVLSKLWKVYTQKIDEKQPLEAHAIRLQIDEQFEAAYHDYAAWKQMFEALDLDRKMVESEVRVAKEIQAIMTAEEAYEFQAKLLGAIMNVITDAGQLRRIQYEFTRLIGEKPEPRSGASGGEIIEVE